MYAQKGVTLHVVRTLWRRPASYFPSTKKGKASGPDRILPEVCERM